jgi:glycosyltransferase involved in cell wall biosynthesis
MIRVAMISPLPPQKVGEAPYAAHLINGLVGTSRVNVVAITGEDAEPIGSPDSKIEQLPIWNGRSLFYPLRLLRQITKRRCHLVHVQFGPYGKVYGGLFGEVMLFLLILLRLAGVKTTITLHSTWMMRQVIERVKKYRILGRVSFLAAPFFHLYMKLLNWGTTTVQLSTTRENSALRRAFLREYGFNPRKVLEIPHPCMTLDERTDRESAAKSIGLEGKTVVLMFGFIRPGKGFETALKAIVHMKDQFPDIALLIAGRPQGLRGDEYLEELHKLANDLQVTDKVHFDTRFIPEEEVPIYFSASTLLLIPYTESIGASGPIHNYAGYGVPIVASDAGFHNRESLGGNLVLFKSGNSDSLAQTLIDLLNQPDVLDDIGQKQVQYAKHENWRLAVDRTIRNYQRTMLS